MSASDRPAQGNPLDEVLRRRGYVLPVHETLARIDPELLQRYEDFAGEILFSDKPKALPLMVRYLVLVGITTAVRGDAEGVEWSGTRAMQNGATEEQVLEAMALAMLPAGVPAFEEAVKAWKGVLDGDSLIQRRSVNKEETQK